MTKKAARHPNRRRPLLSLLVLALLAGPVHAVGYETINGLMSDDRKARKDASASLIKANDLGLVAGIVDALFFIPTRNRAEAFKTLEKLTGTKVERNYHAWVEWLGGQETLTAAEGYPAFKLQLLQKIDPRYKNIFYDGAPARIRIEEMVWGGVRIDGIPPLEGDLAIVPADDAHYLRNDEKVFGVDLGGEQRAYPVRMLSWHEMLNDTVGGQPITLSYCTLCGSGILYDARTPAGGAYTFGTSGLLYRSNKLMFDRQSWSLWNNLTGRAVFGRAAVGERRLTILPMTLTTWGDWRATHPGTTTLAFEQPSPVRFDYRPGAADRARRGVSFPVWQQSDALERDTEIYALEVDGTAKAYPLDVVLAEGLVHDRVGDTNLLLIADADSGAVRAYDRGTHTFTRAGDGTLQDDAGQTWRITEAALEPGDAAPGAEPRARVPGHVAFWFGWFGFYPDTEVYAGRTP